HNVVDQIIIVDVRLGPGCDRAGVVLSILPTMDRGKAGGLAGQVRDLLIAEDAHATDNEAKNEKESQRIDNGAFNQQGGPTTRLCSANLHECSPFVSPAPLPEVNY